MIVNADIKNLPQREFEESGYIVARRDEYTAELWYYGFYRDKEAAGRAAVEIGNGIVLGRGVK